MNTALARARGRLTPNRPIAIPTLDLSPFALTPQQQLIFNAEQAVRTRLGAQPVIDRMINDIVAMVTVEEDHEDDLVITEHPVEYGAAITDHSYKRPSEVRLRVGWSQSAGASLRGPYQVIDVKTVYEQILALQNERNPFTVLTGKKRYRNMLVASIRVHTDAKFEYSFIADISLKQILLVSTQTLPGSINAKALASDEKNTPSPSTGDKQTTPLTVKSEQITNGGGKEPNLVPGGALIGTEVPALGWAASDDPAWNRPPLQPPTR